MTDQIKYKDKMVDFKIRTLQVVLLLISIGMVLGAPKSDEPSDENNWEKELGLDGLVKAWNNWVNNTLKDPNQNSNKPNIDSNISIQNLDESNNNNSNQLIKRSKNHPIKSRLMNSGNEENIMILSNGTTLSITSNETFSSTSISTESPARVFTPFINLGTKKLDKIPTDCPSMQLLLSNQIKEYGNCYNMSLWPDKYCSRCAQEHANTVSLHGLLKAKSIGKDVDCYGKFQELHGDQEKLLNKMWKGWNDGNCQGCITQKANGEVDPAGKSSGFLEFDRLAEDVIDCSIKFFKEQIDLKKTCSSCSDSFHSMVDSYKKTRGTLCADVDNMMEAMNVFWYSTIGCAENGQAQVQVTVSPKKYHMKDDTNAATSQQSFIFSCKSFIMNPILATLLYSLHAFVMKISSSH